MSRPYPDAGLVTIGACPACAATERTPFRKNDRLVLHRCHSCDLVYSDPQPVAEVKRRYLVTYDLARHFESWVPRKAVLFERRLDRALRAHLDQNRLCDVGCGDGQFLELAARRGWNPYGIEMNPSAAAQARGRGARIFEGEFDQMEGLPWGSFDLVTCWDALEHTPTPLPFAERLVRLLAPDGVLIVTTLNRASLAFFAFGMRWSMVVEDHFTYWNRRSLVRLFESLGMEIQDIDIFGLGRDFATALQGFGSWRRRKAPTGARTTSWDVEPKVLWIEERMNRAFRALGGGVGIGATMVRRPGHRDPAEGPGSQEDRVRRDEVVPGTPSVRDGRPGGS